MLVEVYAKILNKACVITIVKRQIRYLFPVDYQFLLYMLHCSFIPYYTLDYT